MHEFFEIVAVAFEVAGVGAMLLGILVSLGLGIRSWARSRDGLTAFRTLRDSIGLSILLGVEILVAADLVRTVTSTPSLTDAAVLPVMFEAYMMLSRQVSGETTRRISSTSMPPVFGFACATRNSLPVLSQ